MSGMQLMGHDCTHLVLSPWAHVVQMVSVKIVDSRLDSFGMNLQTLAMKSECCVHRETPG